MTKLAVSLIYFVKRQNIFIKNKKPLLLKAISLIDYIFHGSLRRIAKKLSLFFELISKSAIHRYVKKFQSKVRISIEAKERSMIAIDETCIKLNGRKCYLWEAVDIFTKELIALDVSRGRSSLDALLFLYKVKARCKGKLPIVLSDSAPWYKEALSRLGFNQWIYAFSLRNAIERFFRYVKERTKIFYNNINDEIRNIELFMKMFAFWYKELR
jgi:transposase-like protein